MGFAHGARGATFEVTLGCGVYSAERRDDRLDPLGGRVVAIEETRDEDTGFPCRVFHTVRVGRVLRWHAIRDAEVDPETMEPASVRRTVQLVRELCRHEAEAVGLSWGSDSKRRVDAITRLAQTLVIH